MVKAFCNRSPATRVPALGDEGIIGKSGDADLIESTFKLAFNVHPFDNDI